jgi:putative SOS response-associated peptidase YedK
MVALGTHPNHTDTHSERDSVALRTAGGTPLDCRVSALPATLRPMCGRYASRLPPDAIRALFATAGSVPNIAPNYNVAPTQPAMVVRCHPETGERRLDLLRWGLIPSWTKDLKAARKPINARSETAGSSGMFKSALASRRCLVPVDVFYEWKTMPDGKQPYAIARSDGTPLAMAGIWEGWRAPDGEVTRTFAIMTTAANTTMQQLHERMPVILEPDTWSTWLGEDGGAAMDLMRPAADDVLHLWPVSRAVNSVRNNGPELLDRIDDPAAPPPSDAPAGANPA